MIPNEIIDAKVGTRQVTAIYLGENLVWPAVPLHYVITDARLVYSTGARLDAGVVGSQYTGNYAYALGTVRVQQGQVIIRELTDVPLNLSVSSQDFHVLRESGISYDIIRGNNLGTTETTAIKSTAVTVSYRDATPRSVGNVEQIINSYTEVPNEWTEWDTEPTIERRPVSGSYWVTMYLTNYDSPSRVCPAYGGYVSLYVSAGHDEANYSFTGWTKLRSYTRTYTSGAVATSTPVVIDQGTTPPQKVGTDIPVDDVPTLNTLPSWLLLNGTNLRVLSEGEDPYLNGRSFTITASNGTATPDEVTVYQQYNRAEPDYIYDTVWGDSSIVPELYNYTVSVNADRYSSSSNAAPASGNVYSTLSVTAWHLVVDVTYTPYDIYETPHWVWTSGEESFGTRHLYNSDVDIVRGTPRQEYDTNLTPTITMSSSGGASAFTWDGTTSRINIPTEGTHEYLNGRNGKITFTNGDATPAVIYIYQEANVVENSVYVYDIQCSLSAPAKIPASGGHYDVSYVSQAEVRDVYTSEAYTDETRDIQSRVTLSGCTGNTSYVSGSGVFEIVAAQNTGAPKTVSVTISYDNEHYASDSRYQNPGSGIYATVTPSVAINGRISLILEIIGAASPYTWPITITNVNINVSPDGGLTNTISPGNVVFPDPNVGETSTVQLASRYSISRPISGSASGSITVQNKTQNPSMTFSPITNLETKSIRYTVIGLG